jgi:hypothetical protein
MLCKLTQNSAVVPKKCAKRSAVSPVIARDVYGGGDVFVEVEFKTVMAEDPAALATPRNAFSDSHCSERSPRERSSQPRDFCKISGNVLV